MKTTSRSFGSTPRNEGRRVSPTPHARAPKTKASKASDPVYPGPAQNVGVATDIGGGGRWHSLRAFGNKKAC
jgi:hypothetical protein